MRLQKLLSCLAALVWVSHLPAQYVGLNLSNPGLPLDIRQPASTMLADSQAVVNIEYTQTNTDQVIGIRATSRPADYYGIGGFFEGGAIGVSAEVNPTGNAAYLGVNATVVGGNGSNIAVAGYAAGGAGNWAGYFIDQVYVSKRLGVGTQLPVYPLEVEDAQGVIRVTSTISDFGSVLELRNTAFSPEYLGAINFNDYFGVHPGQIAYLQNHNLTFRTAYFERMRIDGSGRVGIGTTTPEWPLDIEAPHGVLRVTTSGSNNGSVLELRNLLTSAPYLGAINFNDSIGLHPGQIGYWKNHFLTFRTKHFTRMMIDSIGRVGIGLTPQYPLDVYAGQSVLRLMSSFSDNGSTVELRNIHQSATYLGAINFNNFNGEFPGQISYTTDDNMLFRVNGIERVRIDSLGNVGIGTQSPQYDLDVVSQQAVLHLNSTSDVSGSSLVLQNNTPSPVILGSLQFQDSNGLFSEEIVALDTDAMLFKTAGAERMRMNHLGYVGIGTQNPQKHLDVSSPNTTIARVTSNSNLGAILELRSLSASDNSTGSIHFTDELSTDIWIPASISYSGTHGLSFWANFAERMTIDPDGNIGLGNNEPIWPVDIEADYAVTRMVSTNSTVGAALELKNNTNASSYLGVINFNNVNNGYPGQIAYQTDNQLTVSVNNAERMRINANGLMGVGRQPLTNRLEVEGNASKSSAGDWVANSDVRLKKNVEYLNSKEMLDRLLSLKGIKYEWNDDKTGTTRPEGVQFGFTAQNIQESFPTLVEEDSLGYLQTPYGTYDPMMVEAIRALNEKILSLENKNITLVNENEKLRSDIAEIKAWISSKDEKAY